MGHGGGRGKGVRRLFQSPAPHLLCPCGHGPGKPCDRPESRGDLIVALALLAALILFMRRRVHSA